MSHRRGHLPLVLMSLLAALVGGCEPARLVRPPPAPERVSPESMSGDRPEAGAGLDALQGIDPDALARPRDGLEAGRAGMSCPGSDPRMLPTCASVGVTVDPHYAGSYTCFDLGPVPGLPPTKYGGLVLTNDKCSVTMLIGGEANSGTGKLYKIAVTRDGEGHINGWDGTAAAFIDAPYNDGGVVHGPAGVLFLARWPSNELQQTLPGSTRADKVTDLAELGVSHASASLNFVGPGLPGMGALKLMSWPGGQWYTVSYKPDAQGTFDLTGAVAGAPLPGGPEGFVYVAAGSPLFPDHSLLVSEWSKNEISTYQIDDKADPKLDTRRLFIAGLRGAEGAFRDPSTGDFFFSTWGQAADRVIVVRGFAPIPIVD